MVPENWVTEGGLALGRRCCGERDWPGKKEEEIWPVVGQGWTVKGNSVASQPACKEPLQMAVATRSFCPLGLLPAQCSGGWLVPGMELAGALEAWRHRRGLRVEKGERGGGLQHNSSFRCPHLVSSFLCTSTFLSVKWGVIGPGAEELKLWTGMFPGCQLPSLRNRMSMPH